MSEEKQELLVVEDSEAEELRTYNMTWPAYRDSKKWISVEPKFIHDMHLVPIKAYCPSYVIGVYNLVAHSMKIAKTTILTNAMSYGTSITNHEYKRQFRISRNAYYEILTRDYNAWQRLFDIKHSIFVKDPFSVNTGITIYGDRLSCAASLSQQSTELAIKHTEICTIRLEKAFLRTGLVPEQIQPMMLKDIALFEDRLNTIVRECERLV